MPDAGPWTGIQTPQNNARIDSLPLTLRGFAYDTLDGDRGNSIEWSSDVDGKLGSGAQVTTDDLSVGAHVITLTAGDVAGNASSAEVRITVQSGQPPAGDQRTYLPAAPTLGYVHCGSTGRRAASLLRGRVELHVLDIHLDVREVAVVQFPSPLPAQRHAIALELTVFFDGRGPALDLAGR